MCQLPTWEDRDHVALLSGKDQGKLKAQIVADGNKIHTPGGLHVRVVNSYVHLGSTMGDDNADVERGHNACMQSYAPIAHSFLGIVASG